jgi:cytochrome P450
MTATPRAHDETAARRVALLERAMTTASGRANPFPLLSALHGEDDPLVWMPDGYVAVFGYRACDEVMRSPRFGRQPPGGADSRVVWPIDLDEDQLAAVRAAGSPELGMWLQLVDPPDHTRLKRLVTRAFTPARVAVLRTSIERHFAAVLDRIPPGEAIEFVESVAFPVPAAVIGELVGLPVEDRAWFSAHAKAQRFDKDPDAGFEDLLSAASGRRAIAEYVDGLIDERRRASGQDLVSALIAAEDDGQRLSHPELVALTAMLYIAAYSTTADFLCNALLTLLGHPAELAAVRADPTLVRQANEEVLRVAPVVLSLDYWTKEESDIAGVPIPADSPMHLFLGAANRDPAVFRDPDRFDVHRIGPASLSFGAGAHFCLGAALARLEGEVALGGLLERFSSWQLADPPPERVDYFNYRSFRSIHAVFGS